MNFKYHEEVSRNRQKNVDISLLGALAASVLEPEDLTPF